MASKPKPTFDYDAGEWVDTDGIAVSPQPAPPSDYIPPTGYEPLSSRSEVVAKDVPEDKGDEAKTAPSLSNAPTVSFGLTKEPTAEEDEAAKAEAKKVQEDINQAIMDGKPIQTQQAREAIAIRDGVSVLGKEKVLVQHDDGSPGTATRGIGSATAVTKASATNPALMRNDAVPPAEGKAPDKSKNEVPMHAA